MSVIFGIIEENRVILAGDTRTSTINNKVLSDECQKILPINEYSCIATAGNAAIGMVVEKEINNFQNNDNMNVSTITEIIKNFYKKVNEVKADTVRLLPFSCLIAGRDENKKLSLVAINVKNGNLDIKSVPAILYPPADVNTKICNTIFAKNLKYNHETFAEQTIKEISSISKVVSPHGHKWVYDFTVGKGKLYSF